MGDQEPRCAGRAGTTTAAAAVQAGPQGEAPWRRAPGAAVQGHWGEPQALGGSRGGSGQHRGGWGVRGAGGGQPLACCVHTPSFRQSQAAWDPLTSPRQTWRCRPPAGPTVPGPWVGVLRRRAGPPPLAGAWAGCHGGGAERARRPQEWLWPGPLIAPGHPAQTAQPSLPSPRQPAALTGDRPQSWGRAGALCRAYEKLQRGPATEAHRQATPRAQTHTPSVRPQPSKALVRGDGARAWARSQRTVRHEDEGGPATPRRAALEPRGVRSPASCRRHRKCPGREVPGLGPSSKCPAGQWGG